MGQASSKRRSYTPGAEQAVEDIKQIAAVTRSNGDLNTSSNANGSIEVGDGIQIESTTPTAAASDNTTGRKETKRKRFRVSGLFSLKRTPSGKWPRRRKTNTSSANGQTRPVSCPDPLTDTSSVTSPARPQSLFLEELEVHEEEKDIETVDLSDHELEGKSKAKSPKGEAPQPPPKTKGKRGSKKNSSLKKKKQQEKKTPKKDKKNKAKQKAEEVLAEAPTFAVCLPSTQITTEGESSFQSVTDAVTNVVAEVTPTATTPEIATSVTIPEITTSTIPEVARTDIVPEDIPPLTPEEEGYKGAGLDLTQQVMAQINNLPIVGKSSDERDTRDNKTNNESGDLDAVASSIVSETMDIAQKRLGGNNTDIPDCIDGVEEDVALRNKSTDESATDRPSSILTAVLQKQESVQAKFEHMSDFIKEEDIIPAAPFSPKKSPAPQAPPRQKQQSITQEPDTSVFSTLNARDIELPTEGASSAISDITAKIGELTSASEDDTSVEKETEEVPTINATVDGEKESGFFAAASDKLTDVPTFVKDHIPTQVGSALQTAQDSKYFEKAKEVLPDSAVEKAESQIQQLMSKTPINMDLVGAASGLILGKKNEENVPKDDESSDPVTAASSNTVNASCKVSPVPELQVQTPDASSSSNVLGKVREIPGFKDVEQKIPGFDQITDAIEPHVDEIKSQVTNKLFSKENEEVTDKVKDDRPHEMGVDVGIDCSTVDSVSTTAQGVTGGILNISKSENDPDKKEADGAQPIDEKEKKRLEKERLRKEKEAEKEKQKVVKRRKAEEKDKNKGEKRLSVTKRLSNFFHRKDKHPKAEVEADISKSMEIPTTSDVKGVAVSVADTVKDNIPSSAEKTVEAVADVVKSPDNTLSQDIETMVCPVDQAVVVKSADTLQELNKELTVDVSIESVINDLQESDVVSDIAKELQSPLESPTSEVRSHDSDTTSEPTSPGSDSEINNSAGSGVLKKISLGPRLRTAILRKKSSGASDSEKTISLTTPKSVLENSDMTPPPRKLRPRKPVEQYSPITSGAHNPVMLASASAIVEDLQDEADSVKDIASLTTSLSTEQTKNNVDVNASIQPGPITDVGSVIDQASAPGITSILEKASASLPDSIEGGVKTTVKHITSEVKSDSDSLPESVADIKDTLPLDSAKDIVSKILQESDISYSTDTPSASVKGSTSVEEENSETGVVSVIKSAVSVVQGDTYKDVIPDTQVSSDVDIPSLTKLPSDINVSSIMPSSPVTDCVSETILSADVSKPSFSELNNTPVAIDDGVFFHEDETKKPTVDVGTQIVYAKPPSVLSDAAYSVDKLVGDSKINTDNVINSEIKSQMLSKTDVVDTNSCIDSVIKSIDENTPDTNRLVEELSVKAEEAKGHMVEENIVQEEVAVAHNALSSKPKLDELFKKVEPVLNDGDGDKNSSITSETSFSSCVSQTLEDSLSNVFKDSDKSGAILDKAINCVTSNVEVKNDRSVSKSPSSNTTGILPKGFASVKDKVFSKVSPPAAMSEVVEEVIQASKRETDHAAIPARMAAILDSDTDDTDPTPLDVKTEGVSTPVKPRLDLTPPDDNGIDTDDKSQSPIIVSTAKIVLRPSVGDDSSPDIDSAIGVSDSSLSPQHSPELQDCMSTSPTDDDAFSSVLGKAKDIASSVVTNGTLTSVFSDVKDKIVGSTSPNTDTKPDDNKPEEEDEIQCVYTTTCSAQVNSDKGLETKPLKEISEISIPSLSNSNKQDDTVFDTVTAKVGEAGSFISGKPNGSVGDEERTSSASSEDTIDSIVNGVVDQVVDGSFKQLSSSDVTVGCLGQDIDAPTRMDAQEEFSDSSVEEEERNDNRTLGDDKIDNNNGKQGPAETIEAYLKLQRPDDGLTFGSILNGEKVIEENGNRLMTSAVTTERRASSQESQDVKG